MIHTAELIFHIEKTDILTLEENLGNSYKKANDKFQMLYGAYFNNAYTIQVTEKYGKCYLSLFVDAVRLLGKPDIVEEDYSTIKRRILELLMLLIGHTDCYENHTLKRIDYRYDIVIEDEHIRKLYFHMIGKHINQYRRQIKRKGEKNKDTGETIKYMTTVYHSSKESISVCCYDKGEERKAKDCNIEPYEKNVIRFEVRLKYEHLRYRASKRCKNPLPMQLAYYLKESMFYESLKTYLLPIYRKGDYYKFSEAERIIRASHITPEDKELLITALRKISTYGLSTLKKQLTPYKYKKVLQLLNDFAINPILVPKNYPKSPSKLENPLNALYAKYE